VEVEIEKIKQRLDNTEIKLRNKLLGKKKDENLEDKTDLDENEKNIKDDGFNELRELRKSGVL